MSSLDIIAELTAMFSEHETAGNAIDRFINMKRAGVTFEAIAVALAGGTPNITPPRQSSNDYVVPFGKHKNEYISDVPTDYLRYALDNFDAMREDTRRAFELELEQRGTKPATKQKYMLPAKGPVSADSTDDATLF